MGSSVIFADSCQLPVKGRQRRLLTLGNRPLGGFLFRQASLRRAEPQICKINGVWGRRSLFSWRTGLCWWPSFSCLNCCAGISNRYELDETMPSQNTSPGALGGLKIIDLSRVLGGPYCTQVLADHGADVIKIEPPQGDEVRDWGPPFHEGDAAYFIGVNRNKRGMALDLTRPEGREVLLHLLEDADILLENYKPGTMENGDWATTMCSASVFRN